ncbi:hypothetical protein Tco_0118834, partial [Tanacetum coccineum]
ENVKKQDAIRFEYKRVVGGSKNENNLKGKGKEKVVLVRNESYNKVDNYKEMNKQEGKEHTTSNPKKEKGMKNMMNVHMQRYYKDRKELVDATENMDSADDTKLEDVIEELNMTENSILRNVVEGT